jgi:hypothetical protein
VCVFTCVCVCVPAGEGGGGGRHGGVHMQAGIPEGLQAMLGPMMTQMGGMPGQGEQAL